jgi:hypothetical protein
MITPKELSIDTGVPVRTIQRRCKALGLPKPGTTYVLTPDQAARVVSGEWRRPGRPAKEAR